jgi:hypothetical protein
VWSIWSRLVVDSIDKVRPGDRAAHRPVVPVVRPASGGGAIVLLRLARLARLVVASKRARQLFDRTGRVAVAAVSVMTSGAVVAYYAEHPVNPEFADPIDTHFPICGRKTVLGGSSDGQQHGDGVSRGADGR